ncbi:hypothetical protein TcWFU_001558 [Taenia crassiceps]
MMFTTTSEFDHEGNSKSEEVKEERRDSHSSSSSDFTFFFFFCFPFSTVESPSHWLICVGHVIGHVHWTSHPLRLVSYPHRVGQQCCLAQHPR